jgi:DNA recombination protein RmuC
MVIDSKASKFLMELAEAEGTEAEEEAIAKLARTMNQHLKALSAKDYKSAIIDAHRKAGRGGELGRVISIMYLPNEGALEKVNMADPEFAAKALKADIITAGPTGLTGLVGFASMEIGLARQDENRDRIVEQTAALLESVNVLLGHADKVGRGIKSAADNFRKLSSSVNSRLLPRARGLIGLGVQPGGKKEMHGSLPSYQVVATEELEVIEGEVEEVKSPAELTDQREES